MSEHQARRHDGEVGNGEERRASRGVAASTGSPLRCPRQTEEGIDEPIPSSLRLCPIVLVLFDIFNLLYNVFVIIYDSTNELNLIS